MTYADRRTIGLAPKYQRLHGRRRLGHDMERVARAHGANVTATRSSIHCELACVIAAKENDMAEAWWNGTLIAKSDDIVTVEGNAYFPLGAIAPELLKDSATTSVCPWKGTANYYTLIAGGAENKDAAWYYADPKDAAKEIAGRVAFWKGVQVR